MDAHKTCERYIIRDTRAAGLTFELHADTEALLEAAERTPFALSLVDLAALIRHTRVHLLVLHGALEEALAGLAGEQAVVVAGHLVAADGAELLDALLGVWQRVLVQVVLVVAGHAGHAGGAWREEARVIQQRGAAQDAVVVGHLHVRVHRGVDDRH